jgi:hypothetical protein
MEGQGDIFMDNICRYKDREMYLWVIYVDRRTGRYIYG